MLATKHYLHLQEGNEEQAENSIKCIDHGDGCGKDRKELL